MAQLSPMQETIYRYVAQRPGCTIAHIIRHVYSGTAGGALWDTAVVAQAIRKLNKKLTTERIIATRGQGATYRLVKLKEPATCPFQTPSEPMAIAKTCSNEPQPMQKASEPAWEPTNQR